MDKYKLGDMEQKFSDLIWEHEPLSSRELTALCAEHFAWKRTTTYTMLKRLCDRGIFNNTDGKVSAVLSKSEFGVGRGEQLLEESFNGSLPQFLSAFAKLKKLSPKEIEEIQNLIADHKED